jgi:hypothetical protein
MRTEIDNFFALVRNQQVEIYNEFSLQHELGIFLRKKMEESTKIQFERNVQYFGFEKDDFEKKEIDLAIFSNSKNDLTCAIELKFPRNGQVPESMFSFCKDIAFLEQLVISGFKSAYFIAVADDKLFYSGKSQGIYSLFRDQKEITGIIQKPTGSKDSEVHISGSYIANWSLVSGDTKYCVIKIDS